MKLEMICTGEEVLSGQIIDTNAAWVADTLMNHGIEMQRRFTVGDRMDDLVDTFLERSEVADVVIVNGGLGPTSDDLSAEAMARALDEPLEEHSAWRAHLEKWFRKRGRSMPHSNLKQCLLPASATLIDNPAGSAPGFRVKLNNAWFFFTPGPPGELHPMVQNHLLPFLQDTFSLHEQTAIHKLLTLGHGESALADTLADIQLPDDISLGYRSSMPYVEIKIFARGSSATAGLPECVTGIRQLLDSAVVCENKASIAEEVHTLLSNDTYTLSIAESCTGGMLTSLLVDFPGSSHYLHQGLCTYSNRAKQQLLNVPLDTLDRFGAVSPETAIAMALGVRALQDSDFALAVTGVAGPDGGTEAKPVGMVCISLASREGTWVQTVQLSRRSRHLVRSMSCAIALDMLRRTLCNQPPIADYPFISRSHQQKIEIAQ